MPKNLFFWVGLILIIALACLLFLIPPTNNQLLLNRLDAMDKCFKDRQIPCRWVPGLDNFYGSPIFNYHPPLPYYFGEFILFMIKSLTFSLAILFAVSLVGCYLFMYLFASNLLGKLKASFAAFFYTLLSFLLIVIFKEKIQLAWGLMFFSLTVLSLNLFSQTRKIQNVLFFSISLSLLILSIDAIPLVVGLLSLWITFHYFRTKSLAFLLMSASSMLLAFILSAFYIFPAILESNLVHDASDYLPSSAAEKPKISVSFPYQILAGDSDISNFQQGTNWLRFETNTRKHTIIRLSEFYFPYWRIFIDGKEAPVEYKNNSLGLMTIILGQGEHKVEGRLFDTPIRLISNLVTMVSLIITLFLWAVQFKRVRYWLNYYRKRVN